MAFSHNAVLALLRFTALPFHESILQTKKKQSLNLARILVTDLLHIFHSILHNMGWIASFLYSQLFVTLPKPTKDFSGQTIIVTGSNTGLGLEAARHISRLNAALIVLAVRNRDKGEAAKQSILSSTGRTDATIEVWILDMQSYDSIQAFCAKVNQLRRLDAVLENAGIMTNHFNMVAGYESTITTNVIGTFLLALGVLPKLRQSAAEYNMQPRLSIVSSDLHSVAQFPERHSTNIFAALNDEDSEMAMPRSADFSAPAG